MLNLRLSNLINILFYSVEKFNDFSIFFQFCSIVQRKSKQFFATSKEKVPKFSISIQKKYLFHKIFEIIFHLW